MKSTIKYLTSSGNPYIHENFKNSNVDTMFELFSEEKVRLKYAAGAAQLKGAIKKTYGNEMPEGKDILKFLSELSEDLQNTAKNTISSEKLHTTGEKIEAKRSVFNKETNQKEIITYLTSVSQLGYSKGEDLLSMIDGELFNLQSYLKFLESAIKDSEIALNSGVITDFVVSYFLQNKNAEMNIRSSFSAFNTALNDFISKNSNKLFPVSYKQLEGSEEKIKRDVARLQGYKTAIEKIQQIYGLKDTKRFLQNGPFVVEKAVNRLGGFLFEPICNDAFNMAKNGLLDGIASSLAGEKNAKLTIDPADKKYRTKMTTKNTEDLNFYYRAEKDSVSTELEVKQIPGASLKKISFKPAKQMQSAKVKSDNTLGYMFLKAGMTTSSGFNQEYAAVNMLGNYMKAGGGFRKKDRMTDMYNYIKAGNIATALAGTLTRGDASYFFIVNHKVFQIPDILDSLSKGDGLFGIDHKLEPVQSTFKDANKKIDGENGADLRSDLVYNQILSAKMDMELLIASDLFRV